MMDSYEFEWISPPPALLVNLKGECSILSQLLYVHSNYILLLSTKFVNVHDVFKLST